MALNIAKYTIYINGKEISQSRYNCITSISIVQTVDGASTASLKIADPDFVFINDNIFQEEATIKIYLDWHEQNPVRVTFDGYITAIKADFPSSGLPTLEINCMDSTHRLNRKKKSKTYKKKTSKQVVKSIAKAYGLKPHFTKNWKPKKQDAITQSKQTDIDFLVSLAGSESYPFAVYLRGKDLYYVRKGLTSSKSLMTVHYREYPFDVIEYSPTIAKEEVKKVEASKSTKKKSKSKSKSKKSKKATSKKSKNKSGSSSRKTTTGNTKTKKTKTYNPKTKKWR